MLVLLLLGGLNFRPIIVFFLERPWISALDYQLLDLKMERKTGLISILQKYYDCVKYISKDYKNNALWIKDV